MKILFWCVHGTVSWSMFEDLACALREHQNNEISVAIGDLTDPKKAHDVITQQGFSIIDRNSLDQYDVQFVADPRYHLNANCPIIDLNHGLGSKHDYYYKTTQYTSDYFFVPSKWIADRLISSKTRFIPTGMAKLDRAVKNRQPEDKLILIAPTHNDEYNCMYMIAEQLSTLSKEYRVIIKPHRHRFTMPGDVEVSDFAKWGVELCWDYNITGLLAKASIVISDVSSVYLEAMGLGIPTIVCDNEYMRNERINNPTKKDAHEYMFQEAATVIMRSEQLMDAVKSAQPPKQEYSDRLLSNKGTALLETINALYQVVEHV